MARTTFPLRPLMLALALAALLCPAPCAGQLRGAGVRNHERRVALVIGNSSYATAPLRNPVNDARDMARELSRLGFEVIHHEDLSNNAMKRAIRDFGQKIRGGGVGLFYYAGHAVQVKGVNYLVPVNAEVDSEEEVEYESVDVGFVLAQMENAGNGTNIVILDACRNNPFARKFRSAQRGLASVDAPSGTLIAYSTAPGSVASDGDNRNGLYTEELLRNITIPGLDIEDVFKRVRLRVREKTGGRQTPWESSSLTGDFYFAAAGGATAPPKAQPSPARPPSASQTEARLAEMIAAYGYEVANIKDKDRVQEISFEGCRASWKKSFVEIAIPLREVDDVRVIDNDANEHPYMVSVHTKGLVIREAHRSEIGYASVAVMHFSRKDIALQVRQDLLDLSQRCK